MIAVSVGFFRREISGCACSTGSRLGWRWIYSVIPLESIKVKAQVHPIQILNLDGYGQSSLLRFLGRNY